MSATAEFIALAALYPNAMPPPYPCRKREAELALEAAILLTPAFHQLRDGWVHAVGGGGRVAQGLLVDWALSRFAEGKTAEQVEALAVAELESNRAIVLQMTAVRGVAVQVPIDLGDGAYLVPPAALPPSRWTEVLTSVPFADSRLVTNNAVLLQETVLDPLVTAIGDRQKAIAKRNVAEEARQLQFRADLRLALLLASQGAVDMSITCTAQRPGALLEAGGGTSSAPRPGYIPYAVYVDIPSALAFLADLYAFKHPSALKLAIGRLGSSRGEPEILDTIIDLGMALEIALMHGEGDGKGEITNKVQSRAGWLLGDDLASRLDAGRLAKIIYDARSKAVHAGEMVKHFDAEAADQFVQRVLVALTKRGSFPDWKELTFGGL